MACRRRIIILWNGGAKDFTASVSDLTTPAAERAFPVYIRSIILRRRRRVEGTDREDCVAFKYACAVTMVAVHVAAAAAALEFGNNFENHSKR